MSSSNGSNPLSRNCGAQNAHLSALAVNPTYVDNRKQIDSYARAYGRLAGRMGGRKGVAVIPVVVHVLYNAAVDNISDAQILSQIAVLNNDFRKLNADVSLVPSVWQHVVADAAIEFQLAVQDPDGNATTGITRKQVDPALFIVDLNSPQTAASEPLKYTASGGQSAWDRDNYLNIWVCPVTEVTSGGLLGYAQFPGGNPETDGIVIQTSAFGVGGTALAPFDLGRTATHEVGHWLDVFHIWGDDGNGCNGTDFVNDTPNQGGPNTGKPLFPSASCNNAPNGDMFMNYMDYSDDDSMYMFTKGQVLRMDAVLLGSRASLLSSYGLTPPTPVAAFIQRVRGNANGHTSPETAPVETKIRLQPTKVP
jgi:hypothetical protein